MNRLYWLVVVVGVSANLHAAPAAGEQPTDPAACAAIDADATRLACYDALYRKPASGERPAAQQAALAAVAEAQFGLTQRKAADSEPFKKLESRVAAISRQAAGKTMLTIENGQRWLTTNAVDSDYFRTGDRITIQSAALGSFRATKEGRNHLVPIRRID